MNTLMLTQVVSCLPSARHMSLMCCSGSWGYDALKEMMHNGVSGRTMLIESDDLRNIDSTTNDCHRLVGSNLTTASCCLVYVFNTSEDLQESVAYGTHIPCPVVEEIQIYWDIPLSPPAHVGSRCWSVMFVEMYPLSPTPITSIRSHFFENALQLLRIDLSIFSQATEVGAHFLDGCRDLQEIDLGPLSQVRTIPNHFLCDCACLSVVDLSPLSQVTRVGLSFLEGCDGLTSIDLSPLSHVTNVADGFLEGCSGLREIDLGPLSQLTEVSTFLVGCSGLTSIDLSPLSRVTTIYGSFLTDCTGLTEIDLAPLEMVGVILGAFLVGCTGLREIDMSPLYTLENVPSEIEFSGGPDTILHLPQHLGRSDCEYGTESDYNYFDSEEQYN